MSPTTDGNEVEGVKEHGIKEEADVPLLAAAENNSEDGVRRRKKQDSDFETGDSIKEGEEPEERPAEGHFGCITCVLKSCMAVLVLLLVSALSVLAWKHGTRSITSCKCWNLPSTSFPSLLPPGRICLLESTLKDATFGSDVDDEFASSVDISQNGSVIVIGSNRIVGRGDVRVLEYSPFRQKYVPLGHSRLMPPGSRQYDTNGAFGGVVSLSLDGTTFAVNGKPDVFSGGYICLYSRRDGHKKGGSNIWEEPKCFHGNQTSDIGNHLALSGCGTILAFSSMCVSSVCKKETFRDKSQGLVSVRSHNNDAGLESKRWEPLGEDIYLKSSGNGVHALALSGDGSKVAVAITTNEQRKRGEVQTRNKKLVRVFQYDQDKQEWEVMGSDIQWDFMDRHSLPSLALSFNGTILALGEPYYAHDNNTPQSLGRVRVFKYSAPEANTSWQLLGSPIYGEHPRTEWGRSISLSYDGRRVAAGTQITRRPNKQPGSVEQDGNAIRMYELSGNHAKWDLSWEVTGDMIDRTLSQTSVAISGDGNSVTMLAKSSQPWGKHAVLVYRMNPMK